MLQDKSISTSAFFFLNFIIGLRLCVLFCFAFARALCEKLVECCRTQSFTLCKPEGVVTEQPQDGRLDIVFPCWECVHLPAQLT